MPCCYVHPVPCSICLSTMEHKKRREREKGWTEQGSCHVVLPVLLLFLPSSQGHAAMVPNQRSSLSKPCLIQCQPHTHNRRNACLVTVQEGNGHATRLKARKKAHMPRVSSPSPPLPVMPVAMPATATQPTCLHPCPLSL